MEVGVIRIASQRPSHDPTISRALPRRVAMFEPAGRTRPGTRATCSTFACFAVEPEGAAAAAEDQRRPRLILADAA